MRKLTLIRHGMTDWNLSGRFQGHSNIPLSAEGRAQALALHERLKHDDSIGTVYSSPLSRAFETAQLAFPKRDIVLEERISEINFGVFEGHNLEENLEHECWDWWYADPFQRRAPEGESYQDLRTRAADWLETLPSEQHSVAVAHSGTIQMLISHVLGVEHPKWRKRIFLRHTSLSSLLFRGDEILIECVNDGHHLDVLKVDPFEN